MTSSHTQQFILVFYCNIFLIFFFFLKKNIHICFFVFVLFLFCFKIFFKLFSTYVSVLHGNHKPRAERDHHHSYRKQAQFNMSEVISCPKWSYDKALSVFNFDMCHNIALVQFGFFFISLWQPAFAHFKLNM